MRGARLTASVLAASVAVAALAAASPTAMAGGFAIREQSAEFQGMSFAGNAAGSSLSSMFWNPAATASRDGLNFESSYSVLVPRVNVTVDRAAPTATMDAVFSASTGYPLGTLANLYTGSARDADGISPTAIVGATYGNYQYGNLYIGMGINGAFGLTTEPNNAQYAGATLAETTRLFALNYNPTVAMKIANGISVGVGLQAQTAEGTLRFRSGYPGGPFVSFEGNGWAFGGTAGVTLEPMAGTTIGIGYRSQMSQELDGYFFKEGTGATIHAKTDLKLPDIVTVSLRQVVTPTLRANATFEWSNWSRFQSLKLTANETGTGPTGTASAGQTVAELPANWSDGYMFAVGGEYDLYPSLTVRSGFAYEISPVDDPQKRLIGIPDANRYWMSFGGSWKAFPNTTLDFAWSHVFVEDSRFDRNTVAPISTPAAYTNLTGSIKSSLDIISVGLKTHW